MCIRDRNSTKTWNPKLGPSKVWNSTKTWNPKLGPSKVWNSTKTWDPKLGPPKFCHPKLGTNGFTQVLVAHVFPIHVAMDHGRAPPGFVKKSQYHKKRETHQHYLRRCHLVLLAQNHYQAWRTNSIKQSVYFVSPEDKERLESRQATGFWSASCLHDARGRDCLLYTSPSPRDA